MSTRSRAILAVHRALLRTARAPLDRLWVLAYRLVARAWIGYLARGAREPSGYVRGSIGVDDVLPGLSDVDVALILPEDPAGAARARKRATARWMRLRRAFPPADLLLDYPLILEEPELREVAGSSALTHIDPVYLGRAFVHDKARVLERPGLYETTADWRLVRGPDRRPAEPVRDGHLRRIAAWLELTNWWQWVFPVCADPAGPRTASLCVKLVAEPARIWLWLAHDERAHGRTDALERALRVLPEEEQALRLALDLQRSLTSSPEAPLREAVGFLVRLSERIATLLEEELGPHGATEVRLEGADQLELVQPYRGDARPEALPLCDWRSVVFPRLVDETFDPAPGDPADPDVLGRATAGDGFGTYTALRAGRLIVLPGMRFRTALRAIKANFADPVSFALLDGRAVAAFPEVPGWSAGDMARRALAEHLAWLRAEPPVVWGPEAEAGGASLATLFSAARAAFFFESVEEGDPALPLTLTETTRQLAARSDAARTIAEEALGHYREFAGRRTPPPAATLAAMRGLVTELPVYAGGLDALGHLRRPLAVEE